MNRRRSDDAERVGAGRPVERGGDRSPPVDDDRVVVVVLDVPPAEVPPLGRPVLDHVDAPEEVSGARAAQVGERLGDGHLDVLTGDLVGGTLGIDVLEPLDHQVTRLAGERQARPFQFELREHISCVHRSRPFRVDFVYTSDAAHARKRAARVDVT